MVLQERMKHLNVNSSFFRLNPMAQPFPSGIKSIPSTIRYGYIFRVQYLINSGQTLKSEPHMTVVQTQRTDSVVWVLEHPAFQHPSGTVVNLKGNLVPTICSICSLVEGVSILSIRGSGAVLVCSSIFTRLLL